MTLKKAEEMWRSSY